MGNLYLKYRQGFPKNLDKVFIQKSLANKWAKETELAMEKEQFEDLSTASSTLLKSFIEKYDSTSIIKFLFRGLCLSLKIKSIELSFKASQPIPQIDSVG